MPGALDELSDLYAKTKASLIAAGRVLHDDVGPLLAAAGLHLQLAHSDHPAARGQIQEVLRILEQAMDRVRAVSQELNPLPVQRIGLKSALARLAERHPDAIRLTYSASASLTPEIALAVYEAAAAAATAALQSNATRVSIQVRGRRTLTVQVSDDGRPRGRIRALSIPALLAGRAGLGFAIVTRKGTIVSIRYASRRLTGG